jgi:hypothetical protein
MDSQAIAEFCLRKGAASRHGQLAAGPRRFVDVLERGTWKMQQSIALTVVTLTSKEDFGWMLDRERFW